MLESGVELLGDLLLSALTLLIGSCIGGSIVAALLAVSRGRGAVSTSFRNPSSVTKFITKGNTT
jgi:hypothetical protein